VGAAEFETAVQRLIGQVGHWEAGRWHAPAKAGGSRQAPVAVACTQPDGADSQTPLASVPRTW